MVSATDHSLPLQTRLGEQAVQEWRARVKAEEMYMEAKRDYEGQLNQLRGQIASTSSSTPAAAIHAELDDYKAQVVELQVQAHCHRICFCFGLFKDYV